MPYYGFCAAKTCFWNRYHNQRWSDQKYFDRQSPIKHQVRNSAAHRHPWLQWLLQPVSKQQPTWVKWWEWVSHCLPSELPLVLLQWLLGHSSDAAWLKGAVALPNMWADFMLLMYSKSLSIEKNYQEFLSLVWATLPEWRGEELPLLLKIR